MPWSKGRLLRAGAAPVGYLALSAIYYSRFLLHPDAKIPGGADGVLYAWFFEAVEQSVRHGHNPLYLHYLNVPHGLNLMWNTAVLGVALLAVPLTATIGAPATVIVVMTLSPAVSASCAYAALRRITGAAWPSAIAATLYGFGPFFVGQNGHLHLTLAFFPPLVLLIGYEVVRPRRLTSGSAGVALGLVTAAALLCGEEIVAMTAVVAGFALALLAALHPAQVRRLAGRVARVVAIGAAVALVIVGYPLWFQFFGPQSMSDGPPAAGGLNLAALVRPSGLQYFTSSADIAANRRFDTFPLENTGYLGWPLVVLIVVLGTYSLARRDRIGAWSWLTVLFVVAISLGRRVRLGGLDLGPGPWAALSPLPLMRSIVVARFSLLTLLMVAFGLAWTAARYWPTRRGGQVAATIVAVVVLLPLVPHGRYDTGLRTHTPRFFTGSAVEALPRGSTVLLLPNDPSPNPSATNMMWQLRSGMRFDIVGGYAVFDDGGRSSYRAVDPSFAQLLRTVGQSGSPPDDAALARARTAVIDVGLDYIVVTDQQPHADLVTRVAEELTGCSARRSADVTLCEVPRR